MALNKQFLSTAEFAKKLGISRIAVFRKIQKGEIKAAKIGRSYIIPAEELAKFFRSALSTASKKEIDTAVEKTIEDYGEVLRKLGKE